MARNYQPETAVIPITGGQDEQAHPHLAVIPQNLVNVRYRKAGALSTRPGSSAIAPFGLRENAGIAPSPYPPTAGLLCTRANELVRVGMGELDSVASPTTTTDHIFRDRVPECIVTRTPLTADVYVPGSVAIKTVNGRTVFFSITVILGTATNKFAIVVDAIDKVTGGPLFERHFLDEGLMAAMGQNPRIVATPNYVFASWISGNAVKVAWLDLTTLVWTVAGASVAIDALSGTRYLDMTAVGDIPYLIYATTDLVNNVSVTRADVVAVVAITTARMGGATDKRGVAIEAAAGERAYVGWADFAAGSLKIYSDNLDLTTLASAGGAPFVVNTIADNPTWVPMGISRLSATERVYVFSQDGTSVGPDFWWHLVTSVGGIGYSRNISYAYMATKPFTIGGRWYCGVNQTPYPGQVSSYQTTSYVIDLYADDASAVITTGRLVATLTGAGESPSTGLFYGVSEVAIVDNVASFAQLVGVVSGVIKYVSYRFDLDFSWNEQTSAPGTGDTIVIAGGTPHSYDGGSARELGFTAAPFLAFISESAGGSLDALGVYQYRACFAWIDKQGNMHRSPVSNVLTHTLGVGNNTINLASTCLHLTNRKQMLAALNYVPAYVFLELYRTEGGQSIFKLLRREASTINSSIAVADGASDATIATRPNIYTTGSRLESEMPPSFSAVFRANERVWGVAPDGSVWLSGELVTGEAPWFNKYTNMVIPPRNNERYVMGAQLDSYIVLFTEKGIDVTSGLGPSVSGVGNFEELRRLPHDVGCTDPRSVVVTPYGIFFRSRSGVCLLDRSLACRRIGLAVEDTLGETLTTRYDVTSAVNVPDTSEVRFSVDVDGAQRAVVYDIVEAATGGDGTVPVWSVYDWTCPMGGPPKIRSACYWNGHYAWVSSNGFVFRDDPTTYLDTAAGQTSQWVTPDVTLAPFKGATPMDMVRMWKAGVQFERHTAFDLRMDVYTDNEPSTSQSHTWVASALNTWTDTRAMLRLVRQKNRAIKLRIRAQPPTGGPAVGTGQGMTISAVVMEYQRDMGVKRLPAAQKG